MNTRRNQVNQTLRQFYNQPVAKVSLELVFSIFAVMFFAIFAIRPTLLTMSDLIKEIHDKQDLNQALAQKVAALSTVQAEYLQAQSDFGVLDQAIPPTAQFGQALLILEKIASDNRLTIVDLESREVPKEDTTNVDFSLKTRISKPITMTVLGDYPSIRHFIEDIRNNRREMVVNSIVFSVSNERGVKQLQANINLSIQYFGQ